MDIRFSLFTLSVTSVVWLSLFGHSVDATAQLSNCNCYFNSDCPAETPICVYNVNGGGPPGFDHPDRACEWMTPKPPGGPGTGCDATFTGAGGPCDGICTALPPVEYERQWGHWDGRPGQVYTGSGCLAGGPYPYSVKIVVENEACDLPPHCSLCESDSFIPSGTLATGTAALVESALRTDCASAGFSFEVQDHRIVAVIEDQVFDVCVNGEKVVSSEPPTPVLLCQDGVSPITYQVTGAPTILPSLSDEGLAVVASVILTISVVVLGHRARVVRRSRSGTRRGTSR